MAGGVAGIGFVGADFLGQALLSAQGISGSSPISGIPVSILLGIGINNMVPLPDIVRPGLKFCTTTVLRAGIVCVGAKLSCFDMVQLGSIGLPLVATSVGAGLVFIPWFANKMGLPPRMGSLMAAGTSICGVTAITALAPAIKADSRETSVAVANVVAFGTLGMLVYPYLAHEILSNSQQIGIFLGTAIHDTSQVLGAAATYKEVFGDELAFQTAAVTKLTRNLGLAAVIPGLTWYSLNQAGSSATPATAQPATMSGLATFQKYVPGFVVGFVGMSVARTVCDASISDGLVLGMISEDSYMTAVKTIGGPTSTICLGSAMAAVGLGTHYSAVKGVGVAPFIVGGTGALVVGGSGLAASTMMIQLGLFA